MQNKIVLDEKDEYQESGDESFDSDERRVQIGLEQLSSNNLASSIKQGKDANEANKRLLRSELSDKDANILPITPRKHNGEELKLKNKSPLKEMKDAENVDKTQTNEKSTLKHSKSSTKQIEQLDQNLERPTFKRMTTDEYDNKVLAIRELNLKDKKHFVTNPPPEGKVVQVSIFRDKNGFKNRFYPKYHVMFSVG